MLLVVTVAAITFATLAAWPRIAFVSSGYSMSLRAYLENYVVTASYWIPFIIVAYAIGRRRLSVAMVITLGVLQALSLVAFYLLKLWRHD